MKTNDLKAEMKVLLNGRTFAVIKDNKKGNTRLVSVTTPQAEDIGSVYAFDITHYFNREMGSYLPIEHTEKQLKLKETIRALGF